MEFPREGLTRAVAELARQGVLVGTSSWKYPGWLGMIYTARRYETRGKFSLAKFEATCLTEYAETFRSVCFDGGFYQYPSARLLDAYLSQVPSDFQLSIKVTEDITVLRFPNVKRYGQRAGQTNPGFLNSDLFISRFLGPLAPYQSKMGTLIFEFSHFDKTEYEHGRQFVEALDAFLSQLPKGWRYSVEVRNQSFLNEEYFAVLHRHGISHAFNSWTRMPPVSEQLAMPGSMTADFTAARFLLKAGRSYSQAVEKFEPYSEIRDVYPEGRAALTDLLTPAKAGRPNTRYIYVNNRIEGCALWTIYAALTGLANTQLTVSTRESPTPTA